MKDGDVVRLDYTLWIQGEDRPLETSMESVAQEHGIHRQEKQYKPLTITLGGQQLLPRLEQELRTGAEPGRPLTVELPPQDAYGERDPSKIKDVPMAQFRKEKVQPRPGMELQIQGQKGLITRVAGGRVRVDLNHDLAGKTLRYEVVVRDVLDDPRAKAEAVLEGLFTQRPEMEVTDGQVVVEVPDQAKFDREWPMHKLRLVGELRAAVGTDKAIVLRETFPPMPTHDEEE